MTNNDKQNKGMDPVAAGVVGAVVGAAVGATAVVLSEEKNRQAIGKGFNDVKNKVGEMTSGASDSAKQVISEGEKKVEEAKQAVKSKL